MAQHITVSAYNKEWPKQYESEKEKIVSILKDNCLAIYHIGSTACLLYTSRCV